MIDLDGQRARGRLAGAARASPCTWSCTGQRTDVSVAVHNHPRFGTVWADVGRVPGCYDQSSALGGGELVVVDEYDGPVNDPRAPRPGPSPPWAAADMALLANHGVFVRPAAIRAAHQRAVALEQRCRHAWHVEAMGGGRELPEPARSFFRASDGEGFIGFWEAMARRELRADPTLLDGDGRAAAVPPPGPSGDAEAGARSPDDFLPHADRLLRSAHHYAEQHPSRAHLDVRPRLALAVVACMDSRIDLFDLLELEVGDAHVLRNAGGIVTDDVVRSLALSQRILGTREVVLVHHTDCGMEKVKEDEFKSTLESETGIRPPWALESFTDPFADVRQSVARVQASPFLPTAPRCGGSSTTSTAVPSSRWTPLGPPSPVPLDPRGEGARAMSEGPGWLPK